MHYVLRVLRANLPGERQVKRLEAEIEGWLEVSVLFDVSNNPCPIVLRHIFWYKYMRTRILVFDQRSWKDSINVYIKHTITTETTPDYRLSKAMNTEFIRLATEED
jgi:hypothetical protein